MSDIERSIVETLLTLEMREAVDEIIDALEHLELLAESGQMR